MGDSEDNDVPEFDLAVFSTFHLAGRTAHLLLIFFVVSSSSCGDCDLLPRQRVETLILRVLLRSRPAATV
jgi:hypothetical protein